MWHCRLDRWSTGRRCSEYGSSIVQHSYMNPQSIAPSKALSLFLHLSFDPVFSKACLFVRSLAKEQNRFPTEGLFKQILPRFAAIDAFAKRPCDRLRYEPDLGSYSTTLLVTTCHSSTHFSREHSLDCLEIKPGKHLRSDTQKTNTYSPFAPGGISSDDQIQPPNILLPVARVHETSSA